ncbi:cobyric acid synthase [Candidatus Formimonas warabiya]|uniref:Cobyric acid synthase n=1 Tax=Formimonas warabiya TaxID=1761012 RepID=A0A3G1L0F2_FORW1|nr:cobyric acid synthase [Candidatus Formimonas warabiya]ATW28121.1 cobyric acid synthase CobQ [Candidatus Formimonas warabiya]
MKNKSIMIQGTGSSVGKSILCTALCRIFTQDGYRVNPFKAQNMSNNSFITYEGHEMGRAQVMQAEAAGRAPRAVMNPILLKPTSDHKSQVVIQGKVHETMDAVEYFAYKPRLIEMINAIYHELEAESDIVVIEGAGSPAEINLKQDDLVNMGMAKMAASPVILAGDIDRGGVFASLAGTMLLLDEEEKKMVKGVLINKFRGSLDILKPGLDMLEEIIHLPVLGVIPYFHLNLEDEDSVTEWGKFTKQQNGEIDIAIIKLPHISNFTDFNVLKLYEDVNLRFVDLDDELGHPDVIVIPGTKSTVADMDMVKKSGMGEKIIRCHDQGSYVFGICGGFQIIGEEIRDPDHVESSLSGISGLGLIQAVTTFRGEKTTTLSEGIDEAFQCKVKGYEIHMGETVLREGVFPLIQVLSRNGTATNLRDGAVNQDKTVFGTYFHGIFDSAAFTRSFLNQVRMAKNLAPRASDVQDYWAYKEEQYNKLADVVRKNLNMDKIYRIVEAGLHG